MLSSLLQLPGTSTNPARTICPAVISGQWQRWWIYRVGPVIGTLIIALSAVAKRISEAKLYHFDSDTDRLLRIIVAAKTGK
jgi:aquaporin Z